MMKNKILFSALLLIGFGLMLINSCKKKEVAEEKPVYRLPEVATTGVEVNSNTTALVTGRLDWDGGITPTALGFCWSATVEQPTIDLSTKTIHSGVTFAYPGTWTDQLNDLSLYTSYNVRAYVTNSEGTTYGDVLKFTVLMVGSPYQGGTVAYIFRDGDHGCALYNGTHGLIAALSDQNPPIQWYNGSFAFTHNTDVLLGTGKFNTDSIVLSQGSGSYAAQLCADLSSGGYNDWYLPSKDELNLLFVNRSAIGGFSTESYWSSSQRTDTTAWSQYFLWGGQTSSRKDTTFHVRAIRTF